MDYKKGTFLVALENWVPNVYFPADIIKGEILKVEAAELEDGIGVFKFYDKKYEFALQNYESFFRYATAKEVAQWKLKNET